MRSSLYESPSEIKLADYRERYRLLSGIGAVRSSSVELALGRGLVWAYSACCDLGAEIVLGANGSAGYASQDIDLADVREGIGDGALKEFFGGSAERSARGEIIIEGLKGGEKSGGIFIPNAGRRIVPGVIPFRERERPIYEVAHVRENLAGGAHSGSCLECREAGRGAADSLAAAIRQCRDRVAQ